MAKDIKESRGEQDLIRELAELLNETGLTEIEIEKAGLKLRVARTVHTSATVQPVAVSMAPAAASKPIDPSPAAAALDATNHPGAVPSPMVGTIYLASEPGAAKFVDVGSLVVEGQTLLIIEAMKTMNHIPAPKTGTVRQVLVEDGQPVEFGQPLVIIE